MRAPSKKVSLVILVTVIIVTVIIVYSSSKETDTNTPITYGSDIAIGIDFENDNNDSDGDGLLDWEETLWQTDPDNEDTDGDGTLDGEEVKVNRDPTKPGPDDEIRDIREDVLAEIESLYLDEDSLTNQVAIAFVESYFQLRSSGTLDEATKQQLINEVVEVTRSEASVSFNSIYTTTSLDLTDSSSQEDILDYGQEVIDHQQDTLTQVSLSGPLKNYESAAQMLESLARDLIEIEDVPIGVAISHVDLANGYYVLAQVIRYLGLNEHDPLVSLFGLSVYGETDAKIKSSSEEISNFLDSNGIIVIDGELIAI